MVINRYTSTMCQRKKTHTQAQTICLLCCFKCGLTLCENAPHANLDAGHKLLFSVLQDCLVLFLAFASWLPVTEVS